MRVHGFFVNTGHYYNFYLIVHNIRISKDFFSYLYCSFFTLQNSFDFKKSNE